MAGWLAEDINDALTGEMDKIASADGELCSIEDCELFAALREVDEQVGDETTEKGLQEFSRQEMHYLGDSSAGIQVGGWLSRLLKRLFRKLLKYAEEGGDYLDFLRVMMSSEKLITRRLLGYYRDIDHVLCIHQMLDFARPFGGRVRWDFYKQQLPRMRRLEIHQQGDIAGFSCFDPKRFEKYWDKPDYIREQLVASLGYGKIGFKFYPPMGYWAVDNDSDRLQTVVDVFLRFCCEEKIPVFAHCNLKGFELYEGSGFEYSHPKYWCEALKTYPNLMLCLAHAGGIEGWLAEGSDWDDKDNFPRIVSKLCRKYSNVYCDLSHLEDIFESDDKLRKLQKRLVFLVFRKTIRRMPVLSWKEGYVW